MGKKKPAGLSLTAWIGWYYVPIFFWMGVIFCLSSLQGDGQMHEMRWTFYLSRKLAHVFEYAVLAWLALRVFVEHFPQVKARRLVGVLGALLALNYAVLDEIHQSFVFGREGKFSDILIDGIGIALVLSAYYFFWISGIYKKRPVSLKK